MADYVKFFVDTKKLRKNRFCSFRTDYRRAMREIGFTDPIPGETAINRFIGLFADGYHGFIRIYAAVVVWTLCLCGVWNRNP